jgi:hypothetical protein
MAPQRRDAAAPEPPNLPKLGVVFPLYLQPLARLVPVAVGLTITSDFGAEPAHADADASLRRRRPRRSENCSHHPIDIQTRWYSQKRHPGRNPALD